MTDTPRAKARALNPRRQHHPSGFRRVDHAPGHPLHAYLEAYAEWALVTGCAETTVRARRDCILRFIVWSDERGIRQPVEITLPILERYQRTLHHYRKRNGAPLSVRGQYALLLALVVWFRWMVRQHHILHNPAADLQLPRMPHTLPQTILSVAQVEAIINQADPSTPLGLRNRAMIEMFYSTGIRRMELMSLRLHDLDVERGTLMVRQGKGGKDRMLPVGARACAWAFRYLTEVRPELVTGHDDQTLFLNDFGRPMNTSFIGDLMRRHVEAAGITTPGACHIFRHAMATHMLENGADLRHIQTMLGHASLETTEIYTHVSMAKLKEVHNATHPARLARVRSAGQAAPTSQAAVEPLTALFDADE
jgi:integrase/recombinase XerD